MATDIDLARLCAAISRSRQSLRRWREERREAVRLYVGSHWSEDGSHEQQPVNLLGLYISIVTRSLVAKNPRVMLSTFRRDHKPAVEAMQSWANDEIEALYLADIYQRVVVDALFSIGIAKVALATPADALHTGYQQQAARPFIDLIDLDDFAFQITAHRFEEADFLGHRFRAPLAAVRDAKMYRLGKHPLAASRHAQTNSEGGDERIGQLQAGNYGEESEYEDFVELWEVYLPRERKILTLRSDEGGGPSPDHPPLREVEWLGPECGPYHFLSFGVVPGSAMPKAPIQDLIDLHESANSTFRKLDRQAQRQKEVLPVRSGSEADGTRLLDISDGEAFQCDGEPPSPVTYGAPNASNFAWFKTVETLFDRYGGNLSSLGGLGPQSKTATQDKMLEENSSRTVADLQEKTLRFVSKTLEAMCWYWWHNPELTMRSTWSPQGLPQFATVQEVSPEQRMQVPFKEVKLKVDPYSMSPQTPQGVAAAVMQVVTQVYTPLAPILQQQGVALNAPHLLKLLAELTNLPQLQDLFALQEPPQVEPSAPGEGGGVPASTERRYVRESMPGRTQQGNDLNLASSLMGVDPGGAPGGNGEIKMG